MNLHIVVTDEQQEVRYGIQQLGIITKDKKQPLIAEFVDDVGFSAPVAKAVFKAALAVMVSMMLKYNDQVVRLRLKYPRQTSSYPCTGTGRPKYHCWPALISWL